MDVVDLTHVLQSQQFLSKLLNIHVFRRAFHHDRDALSEDWNSGEKHYDREEIGAKRVSNPERRHEVNQSGGDNDAHRHQHVTQNMQKGSIDVDVATASMVV